MKAAVLTEQPGDLIIEDLVIDKPGPQEVLINVKGAGLCHSDLHFMEGLFKAKVPAVLGHESAGVIEAVGSDVTYVKPGDHVITSPSIFCGECRKCLGGKPHLCANVTEFSLARKHDGSRVENTDVKWLVMRSEVLNWEDDDDDRDLRRYQKSSPGRVAAPVVQGARKRANSVNKTLYKRGKGTEFCTLVLSGKLNIVVGRDGFKVRGESGGRREGERREGGRPGRDRGATGERGAGSRG